MGRCRVAVEFERRNLARHRDTDRARMAARWGRARPLRLAEQTEESEEWVISYMDMVTVLMTVFLGMLAILGMDGRLSAPNDAERAAAAAVNRALQQENEGAPSAAAKAPSRPTAPSLPPTVPVPQPGEQAPLTATNRQWLNRLEALGCHPRAWAPWVWPTVARSPPIRPGGRRTGAWKSWSIPTRSPPGRSHADTIARPERHRHNPFFRSNFMIV